MKENALKLSNTKVSDDGKIRISELSRQAHDLLHLRKQFEADKEAERINDLSNILRSDSLEEIAFKMFE
jgi:hypothetical protein